MLKKEVVDLGYEVTEVEKWSRNLYRRCGGDLPCGYFFCGRRSASFKSGKLQGSDLDELFEATRAILWEKYLPKDGKCWVKRRRLFRVSCSARRISRRIMKKAIARHMQEYYDLDRMPETGNEYPLRVFFYKDQVTVGIDTSGESLHKRGYRQMTSKAPITETTGSGADPSDSVESRPDPGRSVLRKRYFPNRGGDDRANMAPGMNRSFLSESWTNLIPKKCWYDAIDEATEMVDGSAKCRHSGLRY